MTLYVSLTVFNPYGSFELKVFHPEVFVH